MIRLHHIPTKLALGIMITWILISCALERSTLHVENMGEERDTQEALIRKNIGGKAIYLIFSADEFGEGADKILTTLAENDVKGSFFLTGNFLRNEAFKASVHRMLAEGHYIGPHSDRHLLYVSWENRDSLLLSRKEFRRDVRDNLNELKKAGVDIRMVKHYLPPYEWHNREICRWSESLGLRIIGFTPGTGTNADYTTPDMSNYRSSDVLFDRLIRFEETNPQRLNGAILLIHLGTHPDRADKLYDRMGALISLLQKQGYVFERF